MHELPSSHEVPKKRELSPIQKLIGTLGAGLSICLILALAHDRETTYTPVTVPDIRQNTSYGHTIDPACNLVGQHVLVDGLLGDQSEAARWEDPSVFADFKFDKLFRGTNPPVLVNKHTGVVKNLYSENPQDQPALVIFPTGEKRSFPRYLRTIGSVGYPDIDRQNVTPVRIEGTVINTGGSLTPESCELEVEHVLPRTK